MTWEQAYRRARQLSVLFGLRYRVTGRRDGDGWTYRARPEAEWSVDAR